MLTFERLANVTSHTDDFYYDVEYGIVPSATRYDQTDCKKVFIIVKH